MVQYFNPVPTPSNASMIGSAIGQGIGLHGQRQQMQQNQSRLAQALFGNQAQQFAGLPAEQQIQIADQLQKRQAAQQNLASQQNLAKQLFPEDAQNFGNLPPQQQIALAKLFKQQKDSDLKEKVIGSLFGGKPQVEGQPKQQPKESDLLSNEQIAAVATVDPNLARILQMQKDTELKGRREERKEERREAETSYKRHEDFINDTTTSLKTFQSDTKPKLLQMQKLASDDDLIGPTAAVFLEELGIPLGALADPSSELYNKLSLDLLKGLPETYGNRILKVEVDNFLKTIPSLLNSPNGRRMIASNMLKLGEMKEVYYDEMRNQQRQYLDQNKPLARDFQQRVFDQVRPQIDRINNEFVKMSEIKSVPPGTIPFFDPSGDIVFIPEAQQQWALENGGKRIW